jgi:hypothetical protein
MAATTVAEIPNPGALSSRFRIGPFKGKIMRCVGGDSAGTGTTAWAADTGVTITAEAMGFTRVVHVIPLGGWKLVADGSLAMTATPEVVTNGTVLRLHSHGSNTAAALQDITSNAYTLDFMVLGY